MDRATDSCRDGWNVRNGLNVPNIQPNILHSFGERVDCVRTFHPSLHESVTQQRQSQCFFSN